MQKKGEIAKFFVYILAFFVIGAILVSSAGQVGLPGSGGGGTDIVCGNGVCYEGEDVNNCPQDCKKQCTDSDGGLNYYEYGEVFEGVSSNAYSPTTPAPVCGNGVCGLRETSQNCPLDCQSGTSPRGGSNAFKTLLDICLDPNVLNEALCNANGNGEYSSYTCPNGCRDGACIKPGEGLHVCPKLSPPLKKEGCIYTPIYDKDNCITGYDESCKLVKCSDLSNEECEKYDNCIVEDTNAPWWKFWSPKQRCVAKPLASSNVEEITLTSPNGGEIWVKGAIQNIKWDTPPSFAGAYVDITLASWSPPCNPQAGSCPPATPSTVYTLARNVPIGNSLFSWKVGVDADGNEVFAGRYIVRVTELSSGSSDQSDAPFSISDRRICPIPVCAAPPEGCYYGRGVDENGCPTCGNLTCGPRRCGIDYDCPQGTCPDGKTYQKYSCLDGICSPLNYILDPCLGNK